MVVGILVTVVLTTFLLEWLEQRKDWNGGVCKENRRRWILFSANTSAGRGYQAGSIQVWITLPFVDRYREEDDD